MGFPISPDSSSAPWRSLPRECHRPVELPRATAVVREGLLPATRVGARLFPYDPKQGGATGDVFLSEELASPAIERPDGRHTDPTIMLGGPMKAPLVRPRVVEM